MINIIKADLYRIFKGVPIYIALGITVLMISVSIYMVEPGHIGQVNIGDVSTVSSQDEVMDGLTIEVVNNMSVSEIRELMLKKEDYKLDKDILSANMNLYYMFIFVAALAVTVDFSAGSIKNTLSSAIDRKKYFLSKTALVFGVCLLMFFLNTYISYFANLVFNGKNLSSGIGEVTKTSLMQLPPMLALISILNGVAFMTKKTSVYNLIAIPLVMVFQLVLSLAFTLFSINAKYADYELQVMIGKLVNDPSDGYILRSYIVCAVLILVFNTAGWLSFRRSEIR
ncbi:MAG: hypothetical protein J5994_05790 [Ruminococcus sp.]|nr:hypothetical protein [Ruminococcus sp.]